MNKLSLTLIKCLFAALGLSATTTHTLNSMPNSIPDLKLAEKECAFVRKIAVKDADQNDIKSSLVWLDENKTESLLQTKAVDTFLKDTKYLNYAVSTAALIAFLSVAYIYGMTEVKKSTRTTAKQSSNISHCENSCWYHPWWWNHHGYCHHCHCYDCCCSSSGVHSDFNSITLENISNRIMPVLVSIENKSQKDLLLPIGSYLEGLHTLAFNPKDILKKYPNLSSKKCNLWFTYTMSMLLGIGTGAVTVYGATQLFDCLFCSGYLFGSFSLLAETFGTFATYWLFKLGFQHNKYFMDLNSLKQHFERFEDSMTVVRKNNGTEPVQKIGNLYVVHPGQTFEEILLLNSTELTKMQTLFSAFNKDMNINLLYNFNNGLDFVV